MLLSDESRTESGRVFSNQPSLVAKVEIRFGGISGNEKTAGRGVGLESSAMRNRLARAPLCLRSPFSQRAAGEEGVREPHRLGPGAAQPDAEACREPAPPPPPRSARPSARERRALPGLGRASRRAQAGELAGRTFRGWPRPSRPPTPGRVRAPPQGAHPERPRGLRHALRTVLVIFVDTG